MPSDDDSFWSLLLGGGLAYLLLKGQDRDWNTFKERYRKRLERLRHDAIRPPLDFLSNNPNMSTVYRESIFCYLFGLPNSCIPTLVRVLEQALSSKYESEEGTKPPSKMTLEELIDWSVKFLEERTEIAHSFRMLRNYIHTDRLVKEQDCPEALRHISSIIVTLFGESIGGINTTCTFCNYSAFTTVDAPNLYLGNDVSITCGSCRQTYHWILIP